jgi:carbon monoxide dehydrogenase subunit G
VIVEGDYTFPAAREVIWGLLLDPEVIAKTMPGTHVLTRVAEDRFEGKMRVGIGSITAAEFELSVTLADVVAPERYTMQIDGRGRFGFTRGSAEVSLAPDGTSASTVMHFKADMQVGGKIAGLGQRLLDSVSKMMTRQGLEALSRELNRRLGSGVRGPGTGDLQPTEQPPLPAQRSPELVPPHPIPDPGPRTPLL